LEILGILQTKLGTKAVVSVLIDFLTTYLSIVGFFLTYLGIELCPRLF
jgi:hypothetical protein